MPEGQKVEIAFLGDASGLVGAIQDSIGAMAQIQAKSMGFASSMANIAISAVKPIAAALAGAFAAQQSLKAYAASRLPGAEAFVTQMKASKDAVKGVAEAVGEFLAPAAMWASRIIVKIAEPLREAIRVFTAFRNSAVAFLKQLGLNFASAFGTLIPTATKAVKWMMGLFSGPGRNWAKDIEWFRKEWNRIWGAILEYTAPIMVAAAGAIEAALQGIRAAAIAAFEYLKSGAGIVAEWLQSILPAGAKKTQTSLWDIAMVVQKGLITAFVAAEFAIKNWQKVFEVAKTYVLIGVEVLRSAFVSFAGDLWKNMKVAGSNMASMFKHYAVEIGSVFKALGENIGVIFKAVWDSSLRGAKNTAIKMGILATNPVNAMKRYMGGMSENEAKAWDMGMAMFPSVVAPDFSGVKPIPGVAPMPAGSTQPMPGFSGRDVSDTEKKLRESLQGLLANMGSEFAPFLKGRMAEIEKAIGPFIDTIMKGLPGVSGTPGAPIDAPASNKLSKAMAFGSTEAYSAIIKATSGDKQLAEQKKQTGYLRTIANQRGAMPAGI
jgi:hypothetical protein